MHQYSCLKVVLELDSLSKHLDILQLGHYSQPHGVWPLSTEVSHSNIFTLKLSQFSCSIVYENHWRIIFTTALLLPRKLHESLKVGQFIKFRRNLSSFLSHQYFQFTIMGQLVSDFPLSPLCGQEKSFPFFTLPTF